MASRLLRRLGLSASLSASLFAMLREKKRRTLENNVADDRQVNPTVARLSAFTSTRHAVDCLNSGRDVVAAIRHLQEATADSSDDSTLLKSLSDSLNPESRSRLAMAGCVHLCRALLATEMAAPAGSEHEDHSNSSASTSSSRVGRRTLDEELEHLVLDAEWSRGLMWYYASRVCAEEDLACPDDGALVVMTQPARIERLSRLVRLLVFKSELPVHCRSLVAQNVLALLRRICDEHPSHRTIFLSALKVLANIALADDACATAIVQSEWLVRLAEMAATDKRDVPLENALLAHKICANVLYSRGARSVALQTDVYEIHVPKDEHTEPVLDVVLLHGLRGSAFRTWRQRDGSAPSTTPCWPRDWLPDDVRVPIRVVAIDYGSSLSAFRRPANQTLALRSQRFAPQLRAAGIGTRPTVFIGHSMGGLLTERLLLDSSESMGHSTIGCLFLATPHRGSPIAAVFHPVMKPSDDMRLLRLENEQLKKVGSRKVMYSALNECPSRMSHQKMCRNNQLHADFLAFAADRIPFVVSVAEGRETPLLRGDTEIAGPFFGRAARMLVPASSAYMELGALYHVDDTHHNVCKPSDREQPAYRIVLQFINDAIHYVQRITNGVIQKR